MKGSVQLIVVLFLVCGLAAGSLAFVNAATKDRIAEFARTEKIEAMQKVMTEAEEFAELVPNMVWESRRGGQAIGHVLAASTQGYSGPIQTLFGIDAADTVTGVRVLIQTETPGLGAKIIGDKFLAQFRGKSAEQLILRKDDPAGAIDAITAATISSRALTAALKKTLEAYLKGELK
jgi:electron transport complex protein RnfG